MSGEAVIITTITSAGLAVVAGSAAVLAVQLVANWMAAQHEESQERIRQEKAKIKAWQTYHSAQQALQDELTQRQEQTRKQLQSLRLNPLNSNTQNQENPQPQGFIYGDQDRLMHKLQPLFAGIPATLLADQTSALARLRRQVETLDQQLMSGRPPDAHTLNSTQQAVELTVQAHLEELQQQQQTHTRLLLQAEHLLDQTIGYRHLSANAVTVQELASLQSHLLALLDSGTASAASVAVLDKKFQQLKAAIDQELEQRALQAAIRSAAQEHLQTMGYRLLQAEMTEESTWEVPGGEQVKVLLQPDHRLAFQLIHERSHASQQPLSAAEQAFLRQQEQRWCRDLHELLRRLNQDGFQFNIQFERETPQETIPVVVVENAEDWAHAETEMRQPHSRQLP